MKFFFLLTALLASIPTTAFATDWQPDDPLGVDLGSKNFCRKLKEIYPAEEPTVTSDSAEVMYLANPQKIIPGAHTIYVFCSDESLSLLSIIIKYEHSYAKDKSKILNTLNASFENSLDCPEQPVPTDACAIFMTGRMFTIFTANENDTAYALTYIYPEDPTDILERVRQADN